MRLLASRRRKTSSLFRRHVEPSSGVVSYILDSRIAENQQSLYFTQQSMTDDGRFIVFDVSGARAWEQEVVCVDRLPC